jgi:predicted DNA-binding ribbon-helix-helix protein
LPLTLKRVSASRASGIWQDEDYDVLVDGKVVGRIYENASVSAPPDMRWFWSVTAIAPATPGVTNGTAATREQAIGEVSVGVGSAGEDMTNANKGRRSTFKHSTVIKGHKTSVSLEKEFWSALKEIAIVQGTTVHALIGAIDLKRDHTNLCSAHRLFVLDFHRKQLPPL